MTGGLEEEYDADPGNQRLNSYVAFPPRLLLPATSPWLGDASAPAGNGSGALERRNGQPVTRGRIFCHTPSYNDRTAFFLNTLS